MGVPHLIKLQEQYKAQGFIIIGGHCQMQQPASQEVVVAFCKSQHMNYTVNEGARVSGDSSNGLPHAMLFGYDGKLIKEGSPEECAKCLDEAMAKAPHWITRGRLLVATAKISDGLKAGKPFSWALGECESILKKNDEKAKEEAQFLKDQILAEADRMTKDAKTAEADDPAKAMSLYSEISAGWKKTDQAIAADARLKELKADKDFQKELEAAKMAAQIDDMADGIVMPPGKEAYDLNIPQNQAIVQQVLGAVKKLKAKHPDSPQTKKCIEYVKVYGITVP